MTGIDPFAGLAQTLQSPGSAVPIEPTEAIPQILQRRPSRAKRNREWERTQYRVTYRSISPELHDALKAIATKISVPVGEVARAFLEYGLKAYEQGELSLTPSFLIGKMTLYPKKPE